MAITDNTSRARRNVNIKGLSSFDFRTLKPNVKPQNSRQQSDRREALKLLDDLDSDWPLGAPPCIASSIWKFGFNHKDMDGKAVRAKLSAGRMRLNKCCRMYRRQIRRGQDFFHQHQAATMSWSEECTDKLCKHASAYLVNADKCACVLTTSSETDR